MQPLRRSVCSLQLHFNSMGMFGGHTIRHKHWDSAVSSAEKIVGYPTSFMNLRFWLSDEMSNVAVNMRKLIGTKHPLMKTAKGLIFADKENIQTRGLVVLLMSKAAGIPKTVKQFEHHALDQDYHPPLPGCNGNGILETQRSLAELTEMIHTAFVLHRGVMDIDRQPGTRDHSPETEDLLYGNKMALLSGDYLLAKASSGLASLGNTHVVEVMASAISDLMESRFYMEERCEHEFELDDWEHFAYKTTACLYAKACQSALMLSGHPDDSLSHAFDFGKNFGLLRHIKQDHDHTPNGETATDEFFNTLLGKYNIEELKAEYAERAAHSLAKLPVNDAAMALHSFIDVLSKNTV